MWRSERELEHQGRFFHWHMQTSIGGHKSFRVTGLIGRRYHLQKNSGRRSRSWVGPTHYNGTEISWEKYDSEKSILYLQIIMSESGINIHSTIIPVTSIPLFVPVSKYKLFQAISLATNMWGQWICKYLVCTVPNNWLSWYFITRQNKQKQD